VTVRDDFRRASVRVSGFGMSQYFAGLNRVHLFTGLPAAFSEIMTAPNLPITLMLIGIVLRGSGFSFRSYGSGDARTPRELLLYKGIAGARAFSV
jgi:hypothetical protein